MPAASPGFPGSGQSQPADDFSSQGLVTTSVPGESGLRNTFRVLRKHRLRILAVLAVCLGLAIAFSLWMTPVYEAPVLLEVLPEGASDAGGDLVSGAVSSLIGGDQLKPEVETQVQVLRDNAVTLDVIKTLNLQDKRPFKYVPGRFRKDKRLVAEQGMPLEKAPATRERMMRIFQSKLDVEPIPNTRLISVKVSSSDPQQATDIANALIKSLIKNHLQVRYGTMQATSDWMSNQLDDLKKKVDLSQQKLADFERQTGLFGVSISGGSASAGAGGAAGGAVSSGSMTAHSPVLDRFAALNQEKTGAEAARIAKEAVYRLTLTQNPDVVIGLGSSDLGITAQFAQGAQGDSLTLLQNLRSQEAALKLQYADAATKYGTNNPHLAELQNQVTQLNKQMLEEMRRISQRAKNDYELSKTNELEIQKSFNSEEQKAVKVNDDAIKAQVLAEEATSNQALYEELYARLQEASVSVGLKGTNIDIIDPALLPAKPKWPNWLLNIAIALVVGIALGVGYSFFRENLNDTIATAAEVEALTTVTVYGSIPKFDLTSVWRAAYGAIGARAGKQAAKQEPTPKDPAWVIREPNSVISESYRSLRTSLLLSRPSGTLKTIMVTSPAMGDGKSTTSYNLAVALAQTGRRILLIDADLRRPRLHALMQVKASPGLSNVLAAGVDVDTAMLRHPAVETLFFLPAGNIPPTPAELLGSQSFVDLLDTLRGQFDMILLDCTPVLLVTDSVIVGSHADTILMVARAGVTSRRMLQRAAEILQRQCRNAYLAFVVNGVDTMSADYYYTYGYYGKGEYYGNATENS